MRKVKVIIEKAGCNYSAFLPGIHGITGVGRTPELALKSLKESIDILEEEYVTFGDEFPEELLGDYEFDIELKK